MHRISFVRYSDTRWDEISQTFHVSAIRSFFCSSRSLFRYTITPKPLRAQLLNTAKKSHNTQSLHNGSRKKITRHMHRMKKYSNIHAAVWKEHMNKKNPYHYVVKFPWRVSALSTLYDIWRYWKISGKLHSQQRQSLSQTPNNFHFYVKTEKGLLTVEASARIGNSEFFVIHKKSLKFSWNF